LSLALAANLARAELGRIAAEGLHAQALHAPLSEAAERLNAASQIREADWGAMTITRESLSEQFQRLRDEDLLGLFQSGDLIDLAKEVAAEELRRRGVEVAKPATEANTASEDALCSEDNAPSGGGDLVLIARFFTPVEAHMLQSRLEAEGVPTVVADAQIVGVNPLLTMAVGGVRVLVSESDFERAREIVSAIERGDYRLDEQKASK
jgi:hypothetical protein